jgi:hypothetical protein
MSPANFNDEHRTFRILARSKNQHCVRRSEGESADVLLSCFCARDTHLDLVIESPSPSKSRIETIRSICSGKHNDRIWVIGEICRWGTFQYQILITFGLIVHNSPSRHVNNCPTILFSISL